jgi:hypothetical protein
MKKLTFVFAAIVGLAFAFGPATDAFAQAKKANKKLSEGFMEEVSKAKLTWQAPKKK